MPGLPVAERRGAARGQGVHAERLRGLPLRAPLRRPPWRGAAGPGRGSRDGRDPRRRHGHSHGGGAAGDDDAAPAHAGPRHRRHKNPGRAAVQPLLHRDGGDARRRRRGVPGAQEEPRLAAVCPGFPGSLMGRDGVDPIFSDTASSAQARLVSVQDVSHMYKSHRIAPCAGSSSTKIKHSCAAVPC